MAVHGAVQNPAAQLPESRTEWRLSRRSLPVLVALAAVLAVIYRHAGESLYYNWNLKDSYYSHGFLVPFVSLFFAYRSRKAWMAEPLAPSGLGYLLVGAACLTVLAGDFLGFRILAELSIFPMLAGLIVVFMGWRHLALLWFPLAFLLFMIPIPASVTQALVLQVKLIATEGAVQLAQLIALPVIRDGSYVVFGDDRLLVGEVCGGLRSLIALLAFGAIVSYMSRSRDWARVLFFLLSAPVAIASNMLRIFLLCVVGYYWGSQTASGWVHDVSGVLIFVMAFCMLFVIEAVLRRVAPLPKTAEDRP